MSEQEIEAQMAKLYQTQQKCLKLQVFLVVLTPISYVFGFIPLFLNFFVSLFWGTYLKNKATTLVRKRYPYIEVPFGGRGSAWTVPFIEEATRHNDSLTVPILKFNWWSMLAFVASFFTYFLIVLLRSLLLS